MRIAFVLNDLSNSGTNVAAYDLIKQLISKYDVDINIYYLRQCEDELPFEKSKINKFKFKELFNLNSFDIIYSSNLKSDFILFFSKLILKKEIKYVSAIHCIIDEDLAFTYGKIVSKLFSPIWFYIKKKNDGLIIADSMKDYYSGKIDNINFRIIQYGRGINPSSKISVPLNEDLQINNLKSKYKIFGTIGALINRKNYTEAVKLLKRFDNLAWVCLGIGDEYQKIIELITANKLEDRFLYLGQKPDSRVYYKYFDFFFHPSKSEGFPLVLIDSFAHKTPVLISRLDVYKSLLTEDMVYFFNLNDDSSLFKACSEILLNHIGVSNSIKLCYDFYLNELSIEKNADEHFSYFNYLLDPKEID